MLECQDAGNYNKIIVLLYSVMPVWLLYGLALSNNIEQVAHNKIIIALSEVKPWTYYNNFDNY